MASETSDPDDLLPRADPAAAELDALARERDEYLASWQRAQADYQNLRRRMQSDIETAVQRAKRSLYEEILLVLDVLDLALAAPCTTAEGKNLLAGVRMTRSQLQSLLEREGIQPIPEGGRFDPGLHQAVEKVETRSQPAGTILATLRTGYTLQGQILRPAHVRVAAAHTADEDAETSDSTSLG